MYIKSVEDKVRFLFRIYDRDGNDKLLLLLYNSIGLLYGLIKVLIYCCFTDDGLIHLHDLKAVLKACTEENKMVYSDEQLDQLALALYEDAADSFIDGRDACINNADNGLEYEHIKAQLDKHPGLIDELSFR